MKIAFVVHDFLQGIGHGRYCIELARRFSRQHDVHVLAHTFEANLNFPFQRHFVPAWRATALTSVMTFPKNAQNILDRQEFDLVHAQGFACRRANVVTAHVCNAAHYARSPAKSLLKKLFPALVIPRERAFFRDSGAQQNIAVSKVVQAELACEYGVDSSVVYHGVDATQFTPDARTRANRWLFVGEASKGLEKSILALTEFPNAHLTVISRSKLRSFKDLAKTRGLSQRIDFRGPATEIASAYRESEIFVYPSDYDAFGMVVAEAMASGLSVVVSKDIGAAEWIHDGENGFLCNPADLSSIVSQIFRASNAPGVGKNARETAMKYSWDSCAENTMAIYQRAISSKRHKR